MKISTVTAKQILVKSSLPASDYVANPYTGCTHNCKYCYASFMQRFSKHEENWGEFLDVKEYKSNKIPKDIYGKTILLSSVTDAYNPYEMKYHKSRDILKILKNTDANIEILSKSDLMLKDIELLKTIPNLKVGISLNTLDDSFRHDMEPGAPSIERRINALKELSSAGIFTYLFISPIFPHITDIKAIIEKLSPYVQQICFENLNLRGQAKTEILEYVKEKYTKYYPAYKQIYLKNDISYWEDLIKEIELFSKNYNASFVNYFYHNKIKKNGGK